MRLIFKKSEEKITRLVKKVENVFKGPKSIFLLKSYISQTQSQTCSRTCLGLRLKGLKMYLTLKKSV